MANGDVSAVRLTVSGRRPDCPGCGGDGPLLLGTLWARSFQAIGFVPGGVWYTLWFLVPHYIIWLTLDGRQPGHNGIVWWVFFPEFEALQHFGVRFFS